MMKWNLQSGLPIYSQLVEQMKNNIISGEFKSGDKLPSVRELAADAAVNPNTMQRALAELERMGLVYSKRTAGRYITEDSSMIKNLKKDVVKQEIKNFVEKMQKLGFSREELKQLIEESMRGIE